ncbi:MAG: hypothetical protein AB7E61_06710 [Acholeplasmataceae bacterium]
MEKNVGLHPGTIEFVKDLVSPILISVIVEKYGSFHNDLYSIIYKNVIKQNKNKYGVILIQYSIKQNDIFIDGIKGYFDI